MASDFTSQMAEMIAKARPQQASGGHGPAVVSGGGGGMGSFGGQATQTKVGMDLEPIARLLGYKTPEEKNKLAKEMMEHLESIDDKTREQIMQQEPTQKILKGMFNTGYWPVYRDETGLYKLPRMTPEYKARLDKPNSAMIGAGFYGESPRANLVKSEKEARGLSTIEYLAGEGGTDKRSNIISGTQDMNKPQLHASQVALNERAAELERQKGLLVAEQIRLSPEEFALKKKEAAERLVTLNQQFEHAKAQTKLADVQVEAFKEGMDKNSLGMMENVNKDYSNFITKYADKHALVPATDDTSGFRKVSELTPAVHQHIAGIKAYSKGNAGVLASEYSIRGWFSQVQQEMDRPTIIPRAYGVLPQANTAKGEESGNRANADLQKRFRQSYVGEAISMLRESGTKSPDLLQTVGIWMARAGLPHEQRNAYYKSLGLSEDQIADIVAQTAARLKNGNY